MCGSLSDASSCVRREAVLAMQRACQVPLLPAVWRHFLLKNSPQHLPRLLDAEDPLLRGAGLDLLGRLCEVASSGEIARAFSASCGQYLYIEGGHTSTEQS